MDPPDAIFRQLEGQSDRAAAIVAGAFLDDQLGMTIEYLFIDLPAPDVARLFHGTGPLASNYGKILIGYAMGLFGPDTREDLETISSVRNEFAHNSEDINFNSPLIAEHCSRLNFPKTLSPTLQRSEDPRINYLITVGTIYQGLWITRLLPKAARKKAQGSIRD